MGRITIEVGGQPTTYDEQRALRVGREPGSDLMLDAPTVSRNHAEFRPAGDGWEVVDLGSTHGTWVNGQRVTQMMLAPGTTIVRFGLTDGGATANVTLEGTAAVAPATVGPGAPADRPAGPPTTTPPPAAMAATVLPSTPGAPGIPGGGPGLLVRTRTEDLRFGTHAPVRIGREPGLEVSIDDAGVSRQHALVEPRPDGWWFVDRSNSGSFVEGERVTQLKLEEPTTTVLLGHPTAGYELELVPVLSASAASAAIAGKKRRRTLAVVGAALAVLVVIAAAILIPTVLLSDDDNNDKSSGSDTKADAGLTSAELDRAKQASVFVLAEDDSGQPIYSGSGSIISDTGLILTNAHVGKPSAPGQGESEDADPATLLIALTSAEDDKPVEAAYEAEPIVADGVLDLAVLQITADADGNPVDADSLKGELPAPIPIGDSDALRTGDEITALGFPGLASLELEDQLKPALTVTRGVVSTFEGDSMLQSSRAWIDSDLRIGHGNSGGASINDDGELIGVNSAIITAEVADENGSGATQGSSLIRPVNLAGDIIDIANDGGDPEYVSPFYEDLSAPPSDDMSGAQVISAGWTGDGQGGCSGSSTLDEPQQYAKPKAGQVIYAEFDVTGLPDDTPVTFDFYDLSGQNVISSLPQTWTFGSDEVCIYVPFEVPQGADGANAAFTVGDQVLAQNPVIFVKP